MVEPRAEPNVHQNEMAPCEPNALNPLQGLIHPVPPATESDPLQNLIQPAGVMPPQLAPINQAAAPVAALVVESKGLFRITLANAVKNMLKLHYQVTEPKPKRDFRCLIA